MQKAFQFTMEKSAAPVYLNLARSIRTQIQKGNLKPGERLPSSREMAESFGVNRHTVMNAVEELIAEGWVSSSERKGYEVSRELPSSFFPKEARTQQATKPTSLSLVRNLSDRVATKKEAQYLYRFQSGVPDLKAFPLEELKKHFNDSLKRSGKKLLNYSDPEGVVSLREEVSSYLRRLRGINNREVIITNGSQEAIFITAQLFLKEGMAVGVERLGYLPAWEALKAAGARLVPLPMDEHGVLPQAFEKAILEEKIKLLYLTPLHQYPTTLTMPVSRRKQIYDLAVKHRIPILEDDYDHEYHYRSQPLLPLAAQDPNQIVLYISTFSKILFPSSRIGFVAVPESLDEQYIRFKRILSRQNETLLQDAVARWMREGGFERHLRKMRRSYEKKRNTLVECVEKLQKSGHQLSLNIPDGGMAVWLNTHQDADRVAARAAKLGVYVVAESQYQLTKETNTHLRLGFAGLSEKEIIAGMKLLEQAL